MSAAPVKNFAQFNYASPMTKLNDTDRVKYTTLMRNAVESAHYSLDQFLPAISIDSKGKEPPTYARVTAVHLKGAKILGDAAV